MLQDASVHEANIEQGKELWEFMEQQEGKYVCMWERKRVRENSR